MYIKNQVFSDEDTLLEMIFDFSIGDASPYIARLNEEIEKELSLNETYQQYRATLGEEDRLELEAEERDLRLAEILMTEFASFKVRSQKLYGIRDGEELLLYEVDLI